VSRVGPGGVAERVAASRRPSEPALLAAQNGGQAGAERESTWQQKSRTPRWCLIRSRASASRSDASGTHDLRCPLRLVDDETRERRWRQTARLHAVSYEPGAMTHPVHTKSRRPRTAKPLAARRRQNRRYVRNGSTPYTPAQARFRRVPRSPAVTDGASCRTKSPVLSSMSSGSSAGRVAAPPRMEQSVEVAGGPSQLVDLGSRPGCRRVPARPGDDSQGRLLTVPSVASSGRAGGAR
jgi:hypothetical protein